MKQKLYLDVCSLNRPFDDQLQDRIKLEAEAILSILYRCEIGEFELFTSDIIDVEVSNMLNSEKQQKVLTLLEIANEKISLSSSIEKRAQMFQAEGIKLFDALHIASAEDRGAVAFITTDDRLEKLASKISMKIIVVNPVKWLMEVFFNERSDA